MSLKTPEELAEMYKKQDSSSLNYCVKKTNGDLNKAYELFNELKQKKCVPFGKASKESLKYFIPLYKFLRNKGIGREDMYMGVDGSKEYFLSDNHHFFMYDFTIRSKKLIIEYDGIHWHTEPEKDKIKEEFANKYGFKLLRISSELQDNDKFNLINNFLNENIQIKNPDW